MDRVYTDVAIIGGGAAGLAAGVVLGRESDYSVVVLEHGARTGKKLGVTGNGRCNLSHTPLMGGPPHYHGERELARRIISGAQSPEDFFEKLGLFCRTDGDGRVYPYSNTAASVIDSLRLSLKSTGVREFCDFTAVRLEPLMEGFAVYPEEENPIVAARRVIIATGGKSQSSCNGFRILRELNINLTHLYPALCPLITDERLTRPLKNLRVKAKVSVKIDGKKTAAETGEVQFGNGVLSGIAVFNLSRFGFAEYNLSGCNTDLIVSLDLVPDMGFDRLKACLSEIRILRKTAELSDFLTGLLPKRIGEVLIKSITDHPLNSCTGKLSDDETEKLARLIKNWEFPVRRYSEKDVPQELWKSAQVTNGGIPAKELCDNLSLKKYPHLFAAGETVNVFGDCGGYNLAWAWTSGMTAAKSVIAGLRGTG